MGRNRQIFPADKFVCKDCKQEKPSKEFEQSRRGYYHATCKSCRGRKNNQRMREKGYVQKTRMMQNRDFAFVFSDNIRNWH